MKCTFPTLTFIILTCLINNLGYSQNFYAVPDTDLQQFFTQQYPSADTIIGGNYFIDGDHPEIIAETSLIFPNLNIVDATGVEAFVNITELNISMNNVSILPSIPPLVTYFNAFGANLTSLPQLPANLETLITTSNNLGFLPTLPQSLKILTCVQNNLSSLPALPPGLIELRCDFNFLTNIPSLPSGIEVLTCNGNQLSTLPTLPTGLYHLSFQNCNFTVLPALPNSIEILYFGGNDITNIPSIPTSCYNFSCTNNQLTSLPELPSGLMTLDCSYNQIECLPVLPQGLYDLDFTNNLISCLPNYSQYMTPAQLNYPLCLINDPINNPNGCNQAEGVLGYIYKDSANNCMDNQWSLPGVPMRLEDDQNNFLQATQTTVIGSYMFAATPSNYVVKVDTSALPSSVIVTCPASLEYDASTTASTPVSYNNDFGLQCSGFDIAALGGIPTGLVFPGQTHQLKILAGDLSNFANMNCAAGIQGEVTISVSGPFDTIVFVGSPNLLNDSTAIYSVLDFGMQALDTIFLNITTDTMATIADSFTVYLSVTPFIGGDIDPSNDSTAFKYPCINSYDPNKKVVDPQDVNVGYVDPFTYTIYFQNTGNAPAINIRLEDVLDQNLDLETFQLIHASHNQTYTIDAATRKLTVRYPDIYLPDSLSEPLGSIGYFRYKINPIANIPPGTVIENTAFIYFDFNAPIVTNTTENLFYSEADIAENHQNVVKIYPNPSNGIFYLAPSTMLNAKGNVFDALGRVVLDFSIESTETTIFDLSGNESGLYFLNITADGVNYTQRLILR